jgi:hypothetical protein
MVAFKMQMIGYTKQQYTTKDADRLTRAVADTLTVSPHCVAIAFVSDESRHPGDKEASIMVGVTVMAASGPKERKIRHRFTEPSIQREFADNLQKEGVDPASVEESVGGKFVRIGGHAVLIGVKIAIAAGIVLFLVGVVKLYQLKSGASGDYNAIPGA